MPSDTQKTMGGSIAIGMMVGLAIGSMMGNASMGLAVGLGLGSMMGAVANRRQST